MTNIPFHHSFRIDHATLQLSASLPGNIELLPAGQLSETSRFMSINPVTFAHAYTLLGEHPQRFTTDLSLYLSSINTFFERADASGGVQIPVVANSDSKRRLSEDLGVAFASYFMVKVFGLTWGSISQIPLNTQLSSKRPDFQGYSNAQGRYLYEAKGTTKLASIESMLSKAIDQVKEYPESALSKIAIVSYLSADERFFASTSFVVDPPALPDSVPPDEVTSRLLHFEKVLQFSGCEDKAKTYIRRLAKALRERTKGPSALPQKLYQQVREPLQIETGRPAIKKTRNLQVISGVSYEGRTYEDSQNGISVFMGVEKSVLESEIDFDLTPSKAESRIVVTGDEVISLFDDGTVFKVLRIP